MSVSVRMPQLGESVTEGTVTRWLKEEGAQARAKPAAPDRPAEATPAGERRAETPPPAPTGEEWRGEPPAQAPAEPSGAPAPSVAAAPAPQPSGGQAATRETVAPPEHAVAPAAPAAAQQYPRPPTQLPGTSEGPYITPLVRKLAVEHGVDLASVQGTGVGGRIRKQDVLDASRAAQQQWPAAPQAAPPRPAPEPSAPPAPATAQPAAPAAVAEPA